VHKSLEVQQYLVKVNIQGGEEEEEYNAILEIAIRYGVS